MPREIQVMRWCDPCFDEDKRVESAMTYAVALSPGERLTSGARLLELCDSCEEEFDKWAGIIRKSPLIRVDDKLEAPARVKAPARAKAPTEVTPVMVEVPDEDDWRTRRVAMLGKDRVDCPVQGCPVRPMNNGLVSHLKYIHKASPVPQPPTCPDCGLAFKPAGMSIHRMYAHDYDPIASVMATIPTNGNKPKSKLDLKPMLGPGPEPVRHEIPQAGAVATMSPDSTADRIHRYLARRKKPAATGEIQAALPEVSPNVVRSMLTHMVRQGLVVRPDRGFYQVVPLAPEFNNGEQLELV